MDLRRIIIRLLILVIPISVFSSELLAARISDITNTKHNLSVSGPGTTKAVSESQICVFCHTPHAAEAIPGAPLWNRKESGATYTEYTSNSVNASDIAATPGGSSKLCLSCHDGTIAIGSVNVANGLADVTISMNGTDPDGTMPSGPGANTGLTPNTGFTRDLGTDLTNDHPISFTYDDTLAGLDGELRTPSTSAHIADRAPGVRPAVPLEDGQVQCTSCHDPHIRDSDPLIGNIKFLRLNRFQQAAPTGGAFSEANDIICVACHDKLGQVWANSAHAHPLVADETYSTAGADLREFPAGLPVWQASCLNCHDTHAVEGTRLLLREGTDSTSSPKTGGNPAQEETCYQCHSSDGGVLSAQGAGTEVPDIKTDFTSLIRMPITNSDQGPASEIHNINDSDLLEDNANFDGFNRHVECTDCHNPHRVQKTRLFNDNASTPAAAGTHDHSAGHTNIASGVLRGSWGVEPVYGSAVFDPTILPVSYDVKAGDGGAGTTAVGNLYVTREYQVCLRCHSDYAYGATPPLLTNTSGGTTSGTNGMTQFTNQAMEFQAPTLHKAQPISTTDSGAAAAYSSNNHRSWHPVIDNTGRTPGIRNANANNWLAPWNGSADIGNQTMYCSDCHGSNTANGTSAPSGGENGNAWGPHGSGNNFILKGDWGANTGEGDPSGLCFKCHNYTRYTNENNTQPSGFGNNNDPNLHAVHSKRIDGGNLRCSWCHAAVPHGWKNKAFLVNLNDVGPEVGEAPGTQVRNNVEWNGYNNGPYYADAKLKVISFATSGNWQANNCGSAGAPGNGEIGTNWMKGSSEACDRPP